MTIASVTRTAYTNGTIADAVAANANEDAIVTGVNAAISQVNADVATISAVTLKTASTVATSVSIASTTSASTLGYTAINMVSGGQFVVSAGVTFTIDVPFECGLFQCFSTTGAVAFENNSTIRILPQWWGAVGNGSDDDSTAFQRAVDCAIANGSRSIYVPFAAAQKYMFNSTVVIDSGGFQLIGDALGGDLNTNPMSGYITGASGLVSLFNYGNSAATLPIANRFIVMGMAFRDTTDVANAILITRGGNGPERDMLFMNVSARGFVDAIKFDAPSPNTLSAATVTFQNCFFSNNSNSAVNCVDRILGVRYVGNMSEQGGQIVGKIDGGVSIIDNMLEGQSNTINMTGQGACVATVSGNYFEANSGDYVIRFSPTNGSAVLYLRNNFVGGVSPSYTDFLDFVGGVLIEDHVQYGQRPTIQNAYPMSRLNGVFCTKASSTSFSTAIACLANNHRGKTPSGAVVDTTIGSDALITPWGATTTGAIYTGTSYGGYTNITLSYTTDDVVVVAALIKCTSGAIPEMQILDNSFAGLIPGGAVWNVGGAAWGVEAAQEWHLAISAFRAATTSTTVRARFKAGAVSETISVAGVGAYVIPASDFASYITGSGGDLRANCQVFVPF